MNKQVHIAIDARMINSSGIGRYLDTLLQSIVKDDNLNITLIGDERKLCEWKNECNIIHCTTKVYSLFESFIIFKLLKVHKKFDIYYSPHFITPFIGLNVKKRVSTIHDVFHLSKYSDFNLFKKIYSHFLFTNCYRKSDAVIVISNFTSHEINRYLNIDDSKNNLIYNAVSKDSLDISGVNLYPGSSPYYLFVGNIKPHKNIGRIIKAYYEVKGEIDLILVGKSFDGSFTDKLIRRPKKKDGKGSIKFYGQVSDWQLSSLYQNARCLLFPSLYEGFGLPPLEAALYDCPTILSDIPIFSELYGKDEYLVDPESINSIKESMQKIIYDNKYRQKLLDKINNNKDLYDTSRFVDQHLSVFYNVLD